MTAIAHIGQRDMLHRSLDIYVGDETPNGITQILAGGVRKFTPHGEMTGDPPEPSITVSEEQARALLQSLIRHFDGGEDARSLRKDYDAERGRVDKLTATLSELALRPPIAPLVVTRDL